MTWIIYALLTAVFNAAKSVACKKSLKDLDEYVVSWFISFLPVVLLLPVFLLGMQPVPVLGKMFWPVLISDCLLSAIATVWSTKALLKSDLSVTTPLVAFTPLFMLFTGFLMLGEIPSAAGSAGVLLVVGGAYFLNIRERRNGWRAPFVALMKDEGARLMLGAAGIWSVTAVMDKIVMQNSAPVFFVMAEDFLIALFILPFAEKRMRRQKKEIRRDRFQLALLGAFSTAALVCQMIAIERTLVVYVIAIKRLSILFSIILGGVVFKEKDIKFKLVGGAIMVAGVVFLTIL